MKKLLVVVVIVGVVVGIFTLKMLKTVDKTGFNRHYRQIKQLSE